MNAKCKKQHSKLKASAVTQVEGKLGRLVEAIVLFSESLQAMLHLTSYLLTEPKHIYE